MSCKNYRFLLKSRNINSLTWRSTFTYGGREKRGHGYNYRSVIFKKFHDYYRHAYTQPKLFFGVNLESVIPLLVPFWGSLKKSTMASASLPLSDRSPPVVVVLGSTASGKSKLAIDLAKHFGGEVISADSMQVYEGLDILTNKATDEEMQNVPHHMIGVVKRMEKFDVVKFRDMALPIVHDILSKGKVPFIVGGTNYYIESLLWKVLMSENVPETEVDRELDNNNGSKALKKKPRLCEDKSVEPILEFMQEAKGNFTEAEVIEKWTEVELHRALEQVDPNRSLRVHPNDRRKIVRSLQVFFRTGRPHSELIEEQCSVGSDEETKSESNDEDAKIPPSLNGKLGGPLRFPNCLCFWIQADRDILNRRIEERVDKMVDRGIQEEVDNYMDLIRRENGTWDFELGQMQSIGFKEFISYLQLPPNERKTENGQKLFKEGLDRLKIVTKQYAKRQVQWITQRFLQSARRQVPPVYRLDGNLTDDAFWVKNVTIPAKEILDAYIQGNFNIPLLQEKRVELETTENCNVDFISRKCDVCSKILLGSQQWKEHMKSSKHWKIVKKKNKEMETLTRILTNRTLVLQKQDSK